MSAPPLVDPPVAMPTMVSRLPKFSSNRPKSTSSETCPSATTSNGSTFTSAASATTTRLTNGFYHHPGPVTPLPTSAKQNGFIRVPTSFSTKWRKENGVAEEAGGDLEKECRRGKGVGQNRSGNHQYCRPREPASPQRSPVAPPRDLKKSTTPSAGKGRGFGLPVTSKSLLLSPQSSTRTLPVAKSGFHGFKPSQAASGPTNGTKQTPNSVSGSKLRSGTNGFLRHPQSLPHPGGSRPNSGPGSQAGSPLQKKLPAGRSLSSDSLGSAPSVQLSESDRLRSRSLTQVRQPPSSAARPRSPNRSYSTNRTAERGLKEPTASSSAAKSPVGSQAPEGGGKGSGVKTQKSGIGIPSPAALKKPLLPCIGPASKPISYKLSRPSLMKQSRPLRVTSAGLSGEDSEVDHGWRNSVETPSTTENSPESTPEAPGTGGLSAEVASLGELSIVGETLEDMSLSSTSSLDRNDTSQEYMDDFDNLGNGGMGILHLSKNDEDDSGLDQSCTRFDDDKLAVIGITKVSGLCFLDDSIDWAGMRLSGGQGEHRLTRLSRRRRSSQPDYHDQGGSSLDLSPSDSCGSGATYMWDEEGLEPLGGATTAASIHTNSNTTHHIGSFDSDLNSIDVLNNLDSCDLEDDDLMLDVDYPEDASLHSDGEGVMMAQWRRRQLCWGTQDIHSENESDFYKLSEDPGNKRTDRTRDSDLILDLCPPRSPCLSPGSLGSPGLDVEDLAEDCSAVRSQLEHLQRLLLQEEDMDDDTLTTDTLSPEAADSSHSSDTQALLQEVQQLREELRSRDRTIAQLTLQLTVPTATSRCRCQETTGRMDRHTQTSVTERESVASQTPWREHTAFPPVPFLSPPWQYQRSRPYRGRPKASIPSHLARKTTDMSLLQPGSPGTTDGQSSTSNPRFASS